jgi:hypothetical protein
MIESNPLKPILFIGIVEILVEDFRHGEHVNAVLLEDSTHGIVASDLATIARVLKLVLTYVLPYLLDSLRSRELMRSLARKAQ